MPTQADIIVALSNIPYFAVALWLQETNHPYAWLLMLVAIISTLFHLMPGDLWAYYADVSTANISFIWFLIVYGFNAKCHSRKYLALSIASFMIAYLLFSDSGCDRQSTTYVWMHSVWHFLTALALFLLVRSVDLC